jgi:hypothetical protein
MLTTILITIIGVLLVIGGIALYFHIRNRTHPRFIEIPKPKGKAELKQKAVTETGYLSNPDAKAAEMRRKLKKIKGMFGEGEK